MRQFLELSEAAEVKINKIYFKLYFHFCIHHPDTHHSPPEKNLSFYHRDIRLTKKHAENLKYGDPTKGSAESHAASNVNSER